MLTSHDELHYITRPLLLLVHYTGRWMVPFLHHHHNHRLQDLEFLLVRSWSIQIAVLKLQSSWNVWGVSIELLFHRYKYISFITPIVEKDKNTFEDCKSFVLTLDPKSIYDQRSATFTSNQTSWIRSSYRLADWRTKKNCRNQQYGPTRPQKWFN